MGQLANQDPAKSEQVSLAEHARTAKMPAGRSDTRIGVLSLEAGCLMETAERAAHALIPEPGRGQKGSPWSDCRTATMLLAKHPAGAAPAEAWNTASSSSDATFATPTTSASSSDSSGAEPAEMAVSAAAATAVDDAFAPSRPPRPPPAASISHWPPRRGCRAVSRRLGWLTRSRERQQL
eukprot:SAG22_NODE_142_length_17922_cov_10.990406_24_plen_180_part_00